MVGVQPQCRRFEGRVAIVSGALGGIGSATALRLAQEGACVLLADLVDSTPGERMQALAMACQELGVPEPIAVQCDVTSAQQVDATVDFALQQYGRVDAIVNVAGAMVHKSLVELTEQDWRYMLDVNLMGAVHFAHRGLQVMQPGGAIVNVS